MSEVIERVRRELPKIFGVYSGLTSDPEECPAENVYWMNQDRGYMDPCGRTWMLLQLKTWRNGPYDLISRTVQVEVNGELTNQVIYGITGYKDFRVEVRIESNAQDDDMISFNPMDDLMTGLRTFGGKEALLKQEISLVNFEGQEAINVDVPVDDRMRSHAILEMNMRASYTIEEEPSDCWIQKAVVSSNVVDAAGESLPIPPNWKDLLIDGGP